ncbi:hypothetical protein C0991_001693 [Blastosporella zonata]|nr:hypothetical protein C0991_001693 [Blastosporella zonata]
MEGASSDKFTSSRSHETKLEANTGPQDVLLAVVGSTGCGKSTFINTLLEHPVAAVYHGLTSGTAHVQQFSLHDSEYPTRRIVLIDTPGFDNTSIDDEAILKLITQWVSHSYQPSTKIFGIIYLHDITNKRMPRPGLYDTMFKQLLGTDDWARKVVLATTMWDEVPAHVGEIREQDLMKEYWKPMLKFGSRFSRYDGTRASARDLIIPFVAMADSRATYAQKRKRASRAFTFPPLSQKIGLFQRLLAMF